MAEVVAGAEDKVEVNYFYFLFLIIDFLRLRDDRRSSTSTPDVVIFRLQQHGACLVFFIANLTVLLDVIGVFDEEVPLRRRQQIPIPITDGRVKRIFHLANHECAVSSKRCLCGTVVERIVSILVRHNVEQLHRTMRGCRDGQRYLHLLAVGIGRAGIGRDILVVDVDRTLDVPVVGGYGSAGYFATFILSTDVIAVVDDGLGAMHEVARSLPLVLFVIVSRVRKHLITDSTTVQFGNGVVGLICRCSLAVNILGIDEATADARLHIDQVQFDDTCDVAPFLFIKTSTRAILGSQFQIDTRGQCHLVVAVTVVTFTLVDMVFLPIKESLSFRIWTISISICVIRCTGSTTVLVTKVKVTTEGTKEVHYVVDTEVVAVELVPIICLRSAIGGDLFVERHLTDTVDGVVVVVDSLRHAVLSTLHHHAAAPDAAEVCTLDGVHRAAGIA